MNPLMLFGMAVGGVLLGASRAIEDHSGGGPGAGGKGPPFSFDYWNSLLIRYGNEYSVPWRWMKALMMQESSLGNAASVAAGIQNPEDTEASVSNDGRSWGLMQITLATARGLEGPGIQAKDLNNPETSIRMGAELLAELIKTFGIGNRQSIVRAYNGGPASGPTSSATLHYYRAFITHLATVLAQNPGDELEGYT